MIEKFFTSRLIELAAKHKEMLNTLSVLDKLDMPPTDILEMILERLQIKVEDKPEKTEIVLSKGKKKKLRVKTGRDYFVTKDKI